MADNDAETAASVTAFRGEILDFIGDPATLGDAAHRHYPDGVLAVIMLAGVLIRQFFVSRHKGRATLLLPAIAVVLLLGLAVVIAPKPATAVSGNITFAQVKSVLDVRCVGCHAARPTQDGFAQPPKGVVLETPEQIGQNAAKIAETVGNRYMPIGNLTRMTDDERALVAAWFVQGAKR